MVDTFEAPNLDDLMAMPVEFTPGDEPWIGSVTMCVGDGEMLVVTWDEIARSVNVRWRVGGIDRLVIYRESIIRVAVANGSSGVEFEVAQRAGDIDCLLRIAVGDMVTFTDTALRT